VQSLIQIGTDAHSRISPESRVSVMSRVFTSQSSLHSPQFMQVIPSYRLRERDQMLDHFTYTATSNIAFSSTYALELVSKRTHLRCRRDGAPQSTNLRPSPNHPCRDDILQTTHDLQSCEKSLLKIQSDSSCLSC